MLEIKQLHQDQWKEYKKIRLESLKSDPSAFGSSYEEESKLSIKEWQSRINNAVFALLENKIVGMVVYIFNDKINTRHVANIYGLYVIKEYRNRGIGSKLISNILSIIKKNKDISKIKVNVNPQQEYALKIYNHYGFDCVGLLRHEFHVNGKYFDELLMEKLV